MSKNSLLLSLLANSSANPRSSSLMLKTTLNNPYTNFGRSNSISHAKNDIKPKPQIDSQHNVSLVRLNHLLNLKVKNHYYFFFCKLEQAYKKSKNFPKSIQPVEPQSDPKEEAIIESEIPRSIEEKRQQERKESFNKGLANLCDSFNTFISKRQIFLEKESLNVGFASLLAFSSRKRAARHLLQFTDKLNRNNCRLVFNLFHRIQKERMRNQILEINLTQIIGKCLLASLEAIKSFSKAKLDRKKQINLHLVTEVSQPPRGEQEHNPLSQTGQKTSRSKKIILRERKMAPAQSITLIINKAKLAVKQDQPLPKMGEIANDEKMMRSLNLKQDLHAKCTPDLSDNCHLFGEFFPPCLFINTAVTMDSFNTEFKESTESEPNTSRNRPKSQPKSLKNTPHYSKDKSTSNLSINKKQVHLENQQSPLAKIDEILNRIEQMKSFRSDKSIQKRMVNVNLSKELYQSQHQNTIKYRKRTPMKKYEQTQKENMPERLLTQREVASKRKGSISGLDSGTKYKSTVLQKGKEKQGSLSTARKMKMQIENIINRRNKQLYRAESIQLN